MAMRLIFLAALALLLTVTTVPLKAQTAKEQPKRTYKDGAARLNGKMVELRGGQMLPLSRTLQMEDGTRVLPDGTVELADGTKKKLAEGMAVNQTGRIVIFKDDMFTTEAIRENAREAGYKPETVIIETDSTIIIQKE